MRAARLGLLVFLTACAAAPKPFPFTVAGTQQGLLRWQKAGGEPLVCEAVVTRSTANAVRLQLVKGTPKALLQVTLAHDGLVEAGGAMAGRHWRGEAANAPLPLQSWVQLLRDYQTAMSWPDGQTETHSAGARTAVVIAQGRIQSLSVIDDLTGETITLNLQN